MKFASLTQRIDGTLPGQTGQPPINAWAVHDRAIGRMRAGEQIILLSIGQEPDRYTPDEVVQAAIDSLRAGRHHYTSVAGEPRLREAVARHHTRTTGQRVSAENCVLHAGAQNALFALAQVLLESGDEVVLSEPYYTTYPATFTASGARAVPVRVNSDNQFIPDVHAIRDATTDRTRVIVLNSPSNPLGSVYPEATFRSILEHCLEHDIWLISDEVYGALLDPEHRFSPASIAGADRVCVTVSSLSKSHRMTGWRVGWTVGPTTLSTHLEHLALCMHYGLPPFIMDAAVRALETDDVAVELRSLMRARRKVVHETLDTGTRALLLDSGYGMFVLLDVTASGMTALEFADRLLSEEAVATLPCDGFGPAGACLLRMGLCVDEAQLAEACRRINRFIERIG